MQCHGKRREVNEGRGRLEGEDEQTVGLNIGSHTRSASLTAPPLGAVVLSDTRGRRRGRQARVNASEVLHLYKERKRENSL